MRSFLLGTLLVSAFLLLVPQQSLGQTTLYGGIGRGPGANRGEIITISQTNGAGTTLGSGASDPGVGITGLAFDSFGRIFASTISGSPFEEGVSTLIRINPETGEETTVIGPITADGNPIAITDLAVQPGTNVLFGMRLDPAEGSLVYTINKNTGAATLVGPTGALSATLAFAPDGTLYSTSALFDNGGNFVEGYLNTLDPDTGAVLTTSDPFETHIGGLTVRPTDGVIFASGGFPGEIFTLSTDGDLTLLGTTGLGGVGDIAFIPAPTNKDQCKGDGNGWVKFGFQNQGQCIQFVNTGQ